jgi:hypothetical protein
VRLAIDELDAIAGRPAGSRDSQRRGELGGHRRCAEATARRRPKCIPHAAMRPSAGGSPAGHREADLEGVAGLRR